MPSAKKIEEHTKFDAAKCSAIKVWRKGHQNRARLFREDEKKKMHEFATEELDSGIYDPTAVEGAGSENLQVSWKSLDFAVLQCIRRYEFLEEELEDLGRFKTWLLVYSQEDIRG